MTIDHKIMKLIRRHGNRTAGELDAHLKVKTTIVRRALTRLCEQSKLGWYTEINGEVRYVDEQGSRMHNYIMSL